MADSKISELPTATAYETNDKMPIDTVIAGPTSHINQQDVFARFKNNLTSLTIGDATDQTIIDNTGVNIQGANNYKTKKIQLQTFTGPADIPAIAEVASFYGAYTMPDNSDAFVYHKTHLPNDYVDGTNVILTFSFYVSSSPARNVVFGVLGEICIENQEIPTPSESTYVESVGDTNDDTLQVVSHTFSNASATPLDVFAVRLRRNWNHASDNLNGDVMYLGATLDYSASIP